MSTCRTDENSARRERGTSREATTTQCTRAGARGRREQRVRAAADSARPACGWKVRTQLASRKKEHVNVCFAKSISVMLVIVERTRTSSGLADEPRRCASGGTCGASRRSAVYSGVPSGNTCASGTRLSGCGLRHEYRLSACDGGGIVRL